MLEGGPDLETVDGVDRPVVLSPSNGGKIFRFFQFPTASASAVTQEAAASDCEKMGAHMNGSQISTIQACI
jgi:hypothetical protein